MKYLGRLAQGLLLLTATTAMGQVTSLPSQPPQSKPALKAVHAAHPDRGQQVFDQNCTRCHNTPDGFSPNISTTIAMHMRLRANLSDADYKALLHFLNP
jgi:cytochrome c5